MAITFSAEVMKSMGFSPSDGPLEASFTSTTVYEARGMVLGPEAVEVQQGAIGSVTFKVAVAASANDACMALCGDRFSEDEDEWKKEKRCTGPFLLLHIGPSKMHTASAPQVRRESDGSISTLESFPDVRPELEALEDKACPPVLAALACSLGAPDIRVDLRKVDRAICGVTATGTVVHDIVFRLSGTAYVSRSVPQAQLTADLATAVQLAGRLNPKVARFYSLAMHEDDELKKFLYYFLAIEIETHAAFSRIDHAAALRGLLHPTSQPRPAALTLLQRH